MKSSVGKQKMMGDVLNKALKSKVAESVKEEISTVLDISTDKMTAQQAIAYAQIVKALKGDKSAFEAISNAVKQEINTDEKTFSVEVKVVE